MDKYFIRTATEYRGLRSSTVLLRGVYETRRAAEDALPTDTHDIKYGVVSNVQADREGLA